MASKAESFFKDGEKALKKWSIFSGGDKYEEASEAFSKAGNAFKLAKEWEKAGEAYERAALADLKAKAEYEAAGHYADAGHCLKNADVAKAVEKLTEAEAMYEDLGKLSQAAKLEKEMGEMLEGAMDAKSAMAHYSKAADIYKGEDQLSASSACALKVAQFASEAEDYATAVDILDATGKAFIENNLLKFRAKDQFLNAVICHMAAGDPVAADRALKEYKEVDYTFAGTRQAELAEECLAAYVDSNVEDFVTALQNFDKISKLDPWRTKILLRIKNAIQEAGTVDLT